MLIEPILTYIVSEKNVILVSYFYEELRYFQTPYVMKYIWQYMPCTLLWLLHSDYLRKDQSIFILNTILIYQIIFSH